MMHLSSLIASLLLLSHVATAVTGPIVYVPDHCTAGFEKGSDTAIYTVPYTYQQVIGIIGNFKNLTWSGNPPNTVSLNGTDNTPGTARTYDIQGPGYALPVTETLKIYKNPYFGPYHEVHDTNLTQIPGLDIASYIPYDGTKVHSICHGRASVLNLTAHFCSNKPQKAAALLHSLHESDAANVGKLLGGKNFTTCKALYDH